LKTGELWTHSMVHMMGCRMWTTYSERLSTYNSTNCQYMVKSHCSATQHYYVQASWLTLFRRQSQRKMHNFNILMGKPSLTDSNLTLL